MRRTIVLAVLAAFACVEAETSEDASARPDHVGEIVAGLESDDPDRREAAAGRLFDRARLPFSLRDRLEVLTAAARTFPDRTKPGADSSADLVTAAGGEPHADMVPVVDRLFESYSSAGRAAALDVLGRIPAREAAQTWMSVVLRHLDDDVIGELPLGTLADEPRHGDVFLPELLAHVEHPRFGWELTLLALRICKAGLVARTDLAGAGYQVLARYRRHEARLKKAQRRATSAFRFEDEDYTHDRAWASLLLDIMSCFPTDEVRKPLSRGFAYADPRLLYFAAASHLRVTGYLPPKVLREIAAEPEVRSWLFDVLSERQRIDLMPQRYSTQAALAESALVRWLIRDDALGRAPDAIELVDVVSLETETHFGLVDYYVFRFRVTGPHWAADRGWMAGVAGGYVRSQSPTTEDDGWVFSRFEAMDGTSPADHVGNLSELYDRWQRRVEE